MATATQNPGVYDPETEGEQSQPDLGPGHDTRQSGDNSDPRGPGPDSLDSGALRDAENGGGDNPQSGGDTSRPHLRDVPARAAADRAAAEESAADQAGESDASEDSGDRVGKGYNRGKPGDDKKAKSKGKFRITRKQALIGAGTSGIISLVVAFFGVISSGPLEFVHIAQLLTKLGFSSQQDAEDGRLMKIARYINEPSKPQNTRLGFVGTHVANKLDARRKDATGVESHFDRVGVFDYYVVDRNNDKFKGKSLDEVKAQIANDYSIDESAVHTVLGPNGLEYRFNPDPGGFNLFKRYTSQTRTARTLLGESGLSKVASYVGGRILTLRAGWTFHPIRKLDGAIQTAALRAGQKGIDKLKEQFKSDQSTHIEGGAITPPGGDPSAQQGTDSSGKPVPPDPVSTQNKDAVAGIKADAQSIDPNNPQTVADASSHIKAKIAAGGSTLIGAICVLKSINQSVNTERQAKVVAPMMKMAGQYINLGSQVQSGQDLTALQTGFFSDQLDATDKNGNLTSTWNQAQSIEAEQGLPQQTGNDIPKQAQVFTGGGPFDFLNIIPLVGTACDIAGSTFGQIFSIVAGPVNYLVSGAVLGDVAGFMANWLSGAPISPVAAGKDLGNYMAYGTRASGNQQYAAAGGVEMSTTDEQTLKTTTASLDNADFRTKSIAYRLFNTGDSQTLASHLIDNYGSAGPVQTIATMVRSFGNIFAGALKAPASLLSSVVHAASPPYDYHGMKKVGFTADELGDHTYDNPFDNACRVAGGGCKLANGRTITTGILDGPNGKTYIDRAKTCFDVNIGGDSTSGWTTDSNTEAVNFLDTTYQGTDCKDSAQDWLRVRFWLLDTSTIEGYDCYQGDSDTADQSCTDVGFQNQSGASTTPSAPGTLPTGSAKDLATQLKPYLGNKIQCNSSGTFGEGKNCSDIENTASGTSIKGGEGCQVDALDPALLGMLLELVAMNHTFVLSALCSDHHDDGLGGHSGGKAADFNYIDGVYMGQDEDQNGTIPWTTQGSTGQQKISVDQKLLQDVVSFMPKSTGFGQTQCHDPYNFLNGFHAFPDGCHHQHIQVGT
jgi:hypothetical protein